MSKLYNKTKPALKRAKAKGFYTNDVMEKKQGRKSTAKEKRSHDHAAQSKMFSEENARRKASKGAKSNTNKVDKRRRSSNG